MKKIIIGALVLALLLIVGLYNAFRFRAEMEGLEAYVQRASTLLNEGSADEAAELIESALERWEKREGYTHIFLHHDCIDKVTEAFYDYLSIVKLSGKDDAAQRDKLIYHIQSVYMLELPTLGSVF